MFLDGPASPAWRSDRTTRKSRVARPVKEIRVWLRHGIHPHPSAGLSPGSRPPRPHDTPRPRQVSLRYVRRFEGYPPSMVAMGERKAPVRHSRRNPPQGTSWRPARLDLRWRPRQLAAVARRMGPVSGMLGCHRHGLNARYTGGPSSRFHRPSERETGAAASSAARGWGAASIGPWAQRADRARTEFRPAIRTPRDTVKKSARRPSRPVQRPSAGFVQGKSSSRAGMASRYLRFSASSDAFHVT